MNDYFGTPYVESMWSRFPRWMDIFNFEAKRTAAFSVWAGKVIAYLRESYQQTVNATVYDNRLGEQRQFEPAIPTVQVLLELPKILPGYQAPLTLSHYDMLTKSLENPARWVAERVLAEKSTKDQLGV